MSEDQGIEKLLSDLREGRYVLPSWDHEEFTQDQINDFFNRIFGIPWALISNRSSVSDFCEGEWPSDFGPKPDSWITVPEAYARIKAQYGVVASPESHDRVLDVLREIHRKPLVESARKSLVPVVSAVSRCRSIVDARNCCQSALVVALARMNAR